jgi:hypothetical protein
MVEEKELKIEFVNLNSQEVVSSFPIKHSNTVILWYEDSIVKT